MGQAKIKSLDRVLSEGLRAQRERLELSQDEVARAAKASWGLGWRPSTVAAVEAGRRKLSVAELLLLPRILMAAAFRKGRAVWKLDPLKVSDFVPETGKVELVPG